MVRQILKTEPAEMALIDRDDMVEDLAANTADPSFCNSFLPRPPHTCSQGFNAACLEELEDVIAELGIVIEHNVTIGAGKRQGLPELLHDPIASRMRRTVEMEKGSPAIFDDEEDVECLKRQCRNGKEVEGGDHFAMVVQER